MSCNIELSSWRAGKEECRKKFTVDSRRRCQHLDVTGRDPEDGSAGSCFKLPAVRIRGPPVTAFGTHANIKLCFSILEHSKVSLANPSTGKFDNSDISCVAIVQLCMIRLAASGVHAAGSTGSSRAVQLRGLHFGDASRKS